MKNSFLACYHNIFHPPTLNALIKFINAFVSIRWCLPIEANLGYMRAVEKVRQMTLEIVRQRIKDMEDCAEKYEKFKSVDLPGGGRDLLTLVVEERKRFKGTDDEMTDVEIMNQVRNGSTSHTTNTKRTNMAQRCSPSSLPVTRHRQVL
jgi:hypothetical protein